MSDFTSGIFIGALIAGCAVFGIYEAFYIDPLIKKCELNFPRTEACELSATPHLKVAP